MNMKRHIGIGLTALILSTAVIANCSLATAEEGTVLQLQSGDRKILEELLGPGVIGKALPAPVIEKPAQVVGLGNHTWQLRVTGGDHKGTTRNHHMRMLKRDKTQTSWQLTRPGIISYFRETPDGSFYIYSEQNQEEGVITRYDPPEPMLVHNLKPGETRKVTIKVGVYDLHDPQHLTHKGSLDLTYSYLGRFEVTVPAGKFPAVLLRWKYNGKVGPAKVEDLQYRFFTRDKGVVAVIDKKHVSAMLIYNDRSKDGQVLVAKK